MKLFGAIFIGLIYQYYYGGGDTYNFFSDAKIINSTLNNSVDLWFNAIIGTSTDVRPQLYPYVSQMFFYTDMPSHIVSSLAAVLGLLNGTSYLPIALLFAFFSYSGIWAMYKTFTGIYPTLFKELAIALLFIPSMIVWGSSIFKDTVCIFGLGWLIYTTFRIFVNKDLSLKNISLLVLSFTLVGLVKVYILVAFIPALVFWIMATYSHFVRIWFLRFLLQIAIVGLIGLGFVYFSQRFSNELKQYSIDKIAKTVESTRGYIVYISQRDEGSLYDIGEFDPSFEGMIRKFPAAVTVTLFRPFLWEVKNPLMLLSALESFLFLVFTALVLFRIGVVKTFSKIFTQPTLLFFFLFSMIFAFAVGLSTGNFGTLSRYKIPCIPFFAALLLILYFQNKKEKKANVTYTKRSVHHLA
jgi:hypothetical protein